MGTDQKRELESIQNSALRAIFKKKREFGNKDLLKLAKIETIRKRMDKLNNTYIKKCVARKNPIITDLINSYKNTLKTEQEKGIFGGMTLLSQTACFKKHAKNEGIIL